jgi:hypothetical protein
MCRTSGSEGWHCFFRTPCAALTLCVAKPWRTLLQAIEADKIASSKGKGKGKGKMPPNVQMVDHVHLGTLGATVRYIPKLLYEEGFDARA